MIGIISEGKSDRGVIEEICQKVGIRIKHKLMRGNNFDKAKALAPLLFDEGCKRVIVLKDLHRATALEIETRYKKAGLGSDIKLCIVLKAIESWLLADEMALSEYLGSRINPVNNPEELPKPDEYLNDLFRRIKGRQYFKGGEDPIEIARRASINFIEKKCSSFQVFMKLIQG